MAYEAAPYHTAASWSVEQTAGTVVCLQEAGEVPWEPWTSSKY